MKFQVLRLLSLTLYILLGHFISWHWQLLRSYSEWVCSTGRIILTGKNQNTQRKTWPSATLSTTNPTRTDLQVNPESVVRGPGVTVRAIYQQWEKW